MSKWVWILLTPLAVAFIFAAYIGIRIGTSFGNRIIGTEVFHEPPNGYVDLLKGADSGSLRFIETNVPPNRNPVCRYLYDSAYYILETKLNFSDTDRLDEKIGMVQTEITFDHSSYDGFMIGKVSVNFKELNQPDSYKKVSLILESREVEAAPGNDSVLSYRMEKGSFAICRSTHEVPDIYSGYTTVGWNYPGPTELLFKRRGKTVFLLAASPAREKTSIPPDLLIRLVGN
jgi:hypothetical protein